jgi:SagB-type dehydrogenase family enzyme
MAPQHTYVLTPTVRIDRSYSRALTVHAGLGATRASFPVSERFEDDVVELLLQLRTPIAETALIDLIRQVFDVDGGGALSLLNFLIDNEIILGSEMARPLSDWVRAWEQFGWKEPALFHLATYGQRFDADPPAELFAGDSAAAQPEATVERAPLEGTTPIRLTERTAPDPPLREVLERIRPVAAFAEHDVTLFDAFDVVNPVFQAHTRVRSDLGDIVFKSFPSGGARHPLEAYLVVKDVPDARPGVLHFASATGALTMVAGEESARRIDAACFLDEGIQTSKIVVVITCRWLRHMWKYRYARSYRMVWMEVGHAVQSLILSAAAHGYEAYRCLCVDEDLLGEICALSDPLDESPVAVVALGRNGITGDEFR